MAIPFSLQGITWGPSSEFDCSSCLLVSSADNLCKQFGFRPKYSDPDPNCLRHSKGITDFFNKKKINISKKHTNFAQHAIT